MRGDGADWRETHRSQPAMPRSPHCSSSLPRKATPGDLTQRRSAIGKQEKDGVLIVAVLGCTSKHPRVQWQCALLIKQLVWALFDEMACFPSAAGRARCESTATLNG